MSLKPLSDNIVVRQAEAEEQTKSGLFIPDSAKEKPKQGTVIAVGEGKFDEAGKRIPLDVKVGDVVLYGGVYGADVKFEGEDLLVFSQDRVLAIVVS
jgi:chaperonin GroES